MYYPSIKRLLDIIISSFTIVILMPLFIIVFICVKIDSSGPIFFIQKRVGKNLKTFQLFKFRTMTNEKRKVGESPIIGKAEGVTTIGFLLRRLKIDELPQLLNVLRGDMSLIGPRPSVEQQLLYMTEIEKLRYAVSPGLTGLAQVCGNIHLPWKKRFVYDIDYVQNITFRNDLKIVLRTIIIIFIGEDKFIDRPLHIKKKNENS